MPQGFKFSIFTIVLLLLFGTSYIVCMKEQGNFHSITKNEAYRSAILDKHTLENYISKYNIKSIINLCGEKKSEIWYKNEIEVSADRNVKHYNHYLPVSREPREEEVTGLIKIFKSAPRPVLIHCKAGADRSGLAAAIWKVVVDKKPKSEAKKELSIFYGHFPIGEVASLDRYFEKWDPDPLNPQR